MSRRQPAKPFPWSVLAAALVGLLTGYIMARVTSYSSGEVFTHRVILTVDDSLSIEALQPGPMTLDTDSLTLPPHSGREMGTTSFTNRSSESVKIMVRRGRTEL